jgi:hypothetical protein
MAQAISQVSKRTGGEHLVLYDGVCCLCNRLNTFLGSWMHTLFPETGDEIPFEIVNRFFIGEDGVARMLRAHISLSGRRAALRGNDAI